MPEAKLWTRTYSTRDQVPVCPVFTRAKIKVPFWDFKEFAVTLLKRRPSGHLRLRSPTLHTPLNSRRDEGKQCIKNESTTLARLRGIERRKEGENRHRLSYYISRFLLYFSPVRVRVLIFIRSRRMWVQPKMRAVVFGHLHIVVAWLQLSSLHCHVSSPTDHFPLFFILRSLPWLFFCFSFFQPIRTCRWFAADSFLFLTR